MGYKTLQQGTAFTAFCNFKGQVSLAVIISKARNWLFLVGQTKIKGRADAPYHPFDCNQKFPSQSTWHEKSQYAQAAVIPILMGSLSLSNRYKLGVGFLVSIAQEKKQPSSQLSFTRKVSPLDHITWNLRRQRGRDCQCDRSESQEVGC